MDEQLEQALPPGTDLPPGVDPNKPSAGRLYDYYMGGVDWFPVDRHAAEQIRAKIPEIQDVAAINRYFLQRVTRAMARYGIRQFIDVGAGLPTRYNTFQVAQDIDPSARVVYVDNDPMIYGHARHLLREAKNVAYITGDLREPNRILEHPATQALIDFAQPVGLLMVAVIHFVSNDANPAALVRKFVDAVPSGSHLAISHITADGQKPEKVQRFLDVYANATEQLHFRGRDEIAELFGDLQLLPPYEGAEPDVCTLGEWGAHDPNEADISGTWGICGVGRKL